MTPINRTAEPGFCELISSCQIIELVKRIAQATVHFFAVIATDLYETLAWSCEKIYNCITCNCCKSEEVEELEPGPSSVQPRVEDISKRHFPSPNQPTTTTLSQPTLQPRPVPTPPEQIFEEKVEALLFGTTSMEDLQGALNALDANSEEARVYNQVIESRNALNAVMPEDPVEPSLNTAPDDVHLAPLPDSDSDSDSDDEDNELLLPAPGTKIAHQPPLAVRNNIAPLVISAPSFLEEGKIEENKAKALARIEEFQNAVAATLATLKQNIPEALAELAEIDTGTPKGTLKNAPEGVLQRLKNIEETPLRVKNPDYEREKLYKPETAQETIPNPERALIWPEGMRAADKLSDLEKAESPDKSLLRLAELQTLERLFYIRPDAIEFDLDLVLEKYSKTNRTEALREWFGFVYPPPPKRSLFANENKQERKEREEYELRLQTYNAALDSYEVGTGYKIKDYSGNVTKIGLLITEYLSKIHDILTRKRDAIVGGSEQEKEFKKSIQAFIETMMDADRNCPDQMASQLEDRILHLLADELPGEMKTPLDGFKFKMGLVLMHYRAGLVTICTQRVHPYEEHMADLERKVKQKLAEDLGLKGGIFEVDPKHNIGGNHDSVEKISAAVFNEHNPLLFLMDYFHLPNNEHEFYSIRSVRDAILQHVNQLCGLDALDEYSDESKNDPLNKALSAVDEQERRANYLGPLTFPGVLFYLESAGILIRNSHPTIS